MDMGNIVLHMLDQVDLVPSLVPKYVQCCQLTCLNGYSLAKTRLKSKPAFFPTENEKIDLQERRELYDLESLWTVGAEFDDATRLHIFFDMRNSLLGPVGQTKEENLTSKQNMNQQCLARGKASYFPKYSSPI